MTRTQSEQIVREACVKANPNIPLRILLVDKRKPKVCVLSKLAIENGLKPQPYREDGLIVGESRDKRCWLVQWYKKDGSLMYKQSFSKNYIQTIEDSEQPPISLADVFLAVGEKQKGSMFGFSINAYGGFYKTSPEGEWKEQYVADWNLRADSLSEQSDETIHFLAELFSKGE